MSAMQHPLAGAAHAGVRPSLPSATAWVFLGTLAYPAALGDRLLRDPDTFIHVAVGRSIAANLALPWKDTFSHTFAGAPWIAKEWLSQLLFAGAFALAGWAGVVLLAATAAAAALAFLHGFLARRLATVPALAVTLVAAVLCAPHLLARPHVLALPVVVLWTRGLLEAAQARRAPGWAQVLLMLAWANLHGSFPIGFALAGPIALEAVCFAPRARRAGLAAAWSAFLAAALAAACATPYGYHPILVTLTLFGDGETMPYIVEWQPLAFDVIGCFAAALMALTLSGLALRPRANAFRIALLALLAVMAVRHSRFLELFALLAPLLAADPLLPLLRRFGAPIAPAARSGPRWPAAIIAVLVALATLQTHPLPDASNAPAAALAAARARGLTDGKVYNAVDFGGFLIDNGVPTFIDGRSDQIFLGGFTRSLYEAVDSAADAPFVDLIEARGVSWALVRTGSAEAWHLDRAAHWTPVYADAVARVFASTGR